MDDYNRASEQLKPIDELAMLERFHFQRKENAMIRRVFGWFKYNTVLSKQRKIKLYAVLIKSKAYKERLALRLWIL
jgi:hypothetical protein